MNNRLILGLMIVASPVRLSAGESVRVAPACVLSWEEIVRVDASLREDGASQLQVISSGTRVPRVTDMFYPPFRHLTQYNSENQGARGDAPSRTACAGCPGEPALMESFHAILDNLTIRPPCTMGAVGPDHVMTMLNSQVRIQSKSGVILSTVSATAFWTSALPGLTSGGSFPRLVYDTLTNRWLAISVGGGQPVYTLLAVSLSSDPAGSWVFYQIVHNPPANSLTNFPTMGVNATWITFAYNIYMSINNEWVFQGPELWVVDKSTALAGGPLTVTYFAPGFDGPTTSDLATLSPCVTLDSQEPALYIVNNAGLDPADDTNLIRLSRITGTGTAPAWSVVPVPSIRAPACSASQITSI